jgi:hypothetical protein
LIAKKPEEHNFVDHLNMLKTDGSAPVLRRVDRGNFTENRDKSHRLKKRYQRNSNPANTGKRMLFSYGEKSFALDTLQRSTLQKTNEFPSMIAKT